MRSDLGKHFNKANHPSLTRFGGGIIIIIIIIIIGLFLEF
jgi:hypothetical protein